MKQVAWDSVGLNFWKLGRDTAKPSSDTLDWYTENVTETNSVLIIGGTTVDLINAMEVVGAKVSVVDFSSRICNELRDYVSAQTKIINQDVVNDFKNWGETYDLICSDTLINRFDQDEANRFQENLYNILKDNGKMKSTVKIGMYPMDHELIQFAKNNEISIDFWDEDSNTMDYSKAKPILENALIPHGNINKEDLIAWYGNRCKEKRFYENDLRLLFNSWSSVSIIRDYNDRVKVEVQK
ncbi:hypothetical protein [Alkalihalobacterium chitinilyticum]|uniref:Class I SAM-dependent methyltransferase n=1 Tax=Alkalihalobacterium chitinilyticum TaxID=2980103 RepID=A0ABT5VIX9_9BACI|nr:hypothetical protein [Alkalihalobacterium chitinilyticum]MDE5415403.1 hypothetical protein [Alkalihalobacterium chitinilyticum]